MPETQVENHTSVHPSAPHGSTLIDNGIIQYNQKKLSHCDIPKSIQKDYRHTFMDYVSAKRGQFDGVNFSYSIMTDCYFHGATFTNCKFIGTRMYRCNFRGSRFTNCKFDYIDANETRIPSEEVIKCLPDEPNISREICQVLRRNANSLGDIRDSRKYVIKELEDRKEHLRRAIRGRGEYYKRKYTGFWTKTKLTISLFLLKLDSFCWGHGEKIWKIWLPLLFLLAGASALQTTIWLAENPRATPMEAFLNAKHSLRYYTGFFLSVSMPKITPSPMWIEWTLAFFRVLALGMLVSSLFRWLSHR